jgi:hypothetical protein
MALLSHTTASLHNGTGPGYTAANDQAAQSILHGMETMGASVDAPTVWSTVVLVTLWATEYARITGEEGAMRAVAVFASALTEAVPPPDGWSE